MTAHARAQGWARLGASLDNQNIRRYLFGQQLSHVGVWLQHTAELWLILQLTGSGAALGLHSVLRFGPLMLVGAVGGLISDRVDRLQLLQVTQSLQALGAATLMVAALRPSMGVAIIYSVAVFQGFVNAVDNPLRRSFIRDLSTTDELGNAVALNSTVGAITRTVGPAIAGLIIATVGVFWCFLLNTISYAAVLVALRMIDRKKLRPPQFAPRGRGQLRAGFSYAWRDREIRSKLAIAAIVGVFAWNYGVQMPVYATTTLSGDASLYGLLLAVTGLGSFIGALIISRANLRDERLMIATLGLLVLALGSAAAAPNVGVAAASLFLLGASGTAVIIQTQTRLQLRSADQMAGRVMALFSVAFIGSKPIGGAIGGWLIDLSGPRLAFAVGAVAIGTATASMVVHRLATRGRNGDARAIPSDTAAARSDRI